MNTEPHQEKRPVIGLFNDAYTPVMDGVTITVRNYAYWLSLTAGPTFVLTPFVPNHKDNEPFPVVRYFSLPLLLRHPYRIGLPQIDIRLRAAIKKRNFSILHAHSPFLAGQLALRTAREKRIPVVATLHSKYQDDLMRAIHVKRIVADQVKRIVDFYYSVDHVWVPQKSVAMTLRDYGYKGPYEVVENGIDLKVPADIGPWRVAGQKHLEFGENALVGLYVGQHTLEKNLEFLMRGLPAAMARVPEFRMVFVGEGYAKGQLKELAASLGIADKVLFHDLVRNRKTLETIYARADVFLFPSKYDTAGLVVREAAAFKTPSILLEGSDAAEPVRDGVNGFLSKDDPDEFSARLVEVLRDPAGRARAGDAAQASLCRSWESVIAEVKARYLDILSRWA